MNHLEQQFHRAQSRLKSNRTLCPASAQKAVAPLFNPEFVGIRPATNLDRSISYMIRRANRGLAV